MKWDAEGKRERGATLEKKASQHWQGTRGRMIKLNTTVIADPIEHSLQAGLPAKHAHALVI